MLKIQYIYYSKLTCLADGLEDWTFAEDGLMRKRQMSGNDMEIQDGERFFKGLSKDEVEAAHISEAHW
jgi:nuclear transport factor 2 (NTF2) superfamily protein